MRLDELLGVMAWLVCVLLVLALAVEHCAAKWDCEDSGGWYVQGRCEATRVQP